VAVDSANLAPKNVAIESDMTLGSYAPNIFLYLLTSRLTEVGTRLYIAPEVQSRKRRGPRDHSKADMYSLGVSSVDYLQMYIELEFPLDRFL
jgi:translation initiation factor 2-alpha kinase 4